MKHFIEINKPGVTECRHLPTLAIANAAARYFVMATSCTATTYSHNKHGHAIHRRAWKLDRRGKVISTPF